MLSGVIVEGFNWLAELLMFLPVGKNGKKVKSGKKKARKND